MKKSVLVFMVLMLMVIPSVIAVDIDVKTLSGHKVTVFLREPGAYEVLDFHQGKAVDGIISFSSNFSQNPVDLQANVDTISGDSKFTFKQTDVDATGRIELSLTSETGSKIITFPLDDEIVEDEIDEDIVENEDVEEEAEPEVVEEVVQEEIVVEENQENVRGISGNVVESIKGVFSSKITYYIIGAIVGLFLLVVVIQVGRMKLGKRAKFDISVGSNRDDLTIADAENKLSEAKKELDEIKDRKKKLKEAKERFERDKEELKRLED